MNYMTREWSLVPFDAPGDRTVDISPWDVGGVRLARLVFQDPTTETAVFEVLVQGVWVQVLSRTRKELLKRLGSGAITATRKPEDRAH